MKLRSDNLCVLTRETPDEMRAAGRHNPARVLVRGKKFRIALAAGANDEIHVFRSGETLYVLAIDKSIPTVLLETYDLLSPEKLGYVFFQEWQAEPFLKDRRRPINIAKQLAEHLPEEAL